MQVLSFLHLKYRGLVISLFYVTTREISFARDFQNDTYVLRNTKNVCKAGVRGFEHTESLESNWPKKRLFEKTTEWNYSEAYNETDTE